jgi:serine/threonine-protein kinase
VTWDTYRLADCHWLTTSNTGHIEGEQGMWGRGTVLGGRYTLAERIGGGAMGEVWRALDGVLERAVAVKILLPKLLEDPQFAARFRREAKVLASLSHPGIVDVHDYGEEPAAEEDGDRIAYIVMALVDGHPLDEVREDEGPMPVGRALGIVAEALDALHAAHRRGIVHRDLKPSNLMLREDGRVTVTDFGIAHSKAASRLTASHAVLGTALYIAPEQAEGIATVPASDLYSLGVVAYELLTGNVPFNGDTVLEIVLKHIREPAPELPPTFPEPVRAFVARALAKTPEARWPDAAAMATAARKAANTASEMADPGTDAGLAAYAGPLPATPAQPHGQLGRPGGEWGLPCSSEAESLGKGGHGAAPGGAAPTPMPPPPLPLPAPAANATSAPGTPAPAPDTPTPLLVSGPATTSTPTPTPTPRWKRHRKPLLILVPVALTAATVTVFNLLPGEKRDNANGTPTPTGSSAATPGAQPPASPPTGPKPPGTTTPATGPAKDAAGGTGAAAGGSGKQAATTGQSGGGAATGNASTGTGTNNGGSNSTGTGNSGNTGNTNAGTGDKPKPPPPGPAKPPNCGGDNWGAITNVGTGRKMGLANASSTGTGGKVVSGGNTQFGWVQGGNQFAEFHACNLAGSALGLKQAPAYDEKTGAVIAETTGYSGYVTGWKTTPAAGGAHQINYYVGDGCVTDVGAGRQLTVEACTPGNKAQLWRLP